MTHSPKRRFFVPEVVQTSAMDCGPASLKCLLQGFDISVSYGRLREACQTDVDGTSIDTMEEVAIQLGLNAEQVVVPLDHFLIPESKLLPAIVVVVLPGGTTHFLVVWRRHGDWLQVMDPGTGRRWVRLQRFLNEVYIHQMNVPADDWHEWAVSEQFTLILERQLGQIGIPSKKAHDLIQEAAQAADWKDIATLDAATRMVNALVRSKAIDKGGASCRVLESIYREAVTDEGTAAELIPAMFWAVRPAEAADEGTPMLNMRGAVFVRVLGTDSSDTEAPEEQLDETLEGSDAPAALSPELIAALEEAPSRPGLEILSFLRQDGLFALPAVASALLLAAGAVLIQAILFRGFLDIGDRLNIVEQRIGAVSAILLFIIIVLLLEVSIVSSVVRLGRHLEIRLRQAFLGKIPRLEDSYFSSRLTSDMAERGHSIQSVRRVVTLGQDLLRAVFTLVLTTAGIIWLDVGSAPLAILTTVVAVALPLVAQPTLAERDLRVRSHYASLTRFYLDALLGLTALRTHSAERSVRREHESLLVEWIRAGVSLLRATVTLESVQSVAGMALAGWLVLGFLERSGGSRDMLLLAFWALSLPTIGAQVAAAALEYPMLRNLTLRLTEPLGAPERTIAADKERRGSSSMPKEEKPQQGGVHLELKGVDVRVAGNKILHNIDLEVPSGQHLAVVGASGAGKSSLLGLLLGWYRAAAGEIRVDGELLDAERLEQLRLRTAWVDPAVQLWNKTLLKNLIYGTRIDADRPIAGAIESANLRGVLESLPDGLQTSIGEGGGFVSGGEGQRVRLGRALLRPEVNLAVLDEPFRGLDREQRRILLRRTRAYWKDATLICVTHDVSETAGFERVIVIDEGRIVEDGDPKILNQMENSHYGRMIAAEKDVREDLWNDRDWRRLWLEKGKLKELTERKQG